MVACRWNLYLSSVGSSYPAYKQQNHISVCFSVCKPNVSEPKLRFTSTRNCQLGFRKIFSSSRYHNLPVLLGFASASCMTLSLLLCVSLPVASNMKSSIPGPHLQAFRREISIALVLKSCVLLEFYCVFFSLVITLCNKYVSDNISIVKSSGVILDFRTEK